MTEMMKQRWAGNEYFQLLKSWCDKLVSLQVTQFEQKELYGGIICPACGRIHGRCADAIYPMMFVAQATGDERYITCARALFDWSGNLFHEEGFYYNDTNSDWRGITVFFVVQMGETLLSYGHLLDDDTRRRWTERMELTSTYLKEHIEEIGGNINYPVTCAYAMAVAARVLKDETCEKKAAQLALKALGYFTEEYLLYGEGKSRDFISPKGCRPIDVGYNAEESLPALLACGLLIGDEAVKEMAVKSMKAHLEFMLPDGAWDNSWGTRNNKWSYWGSRTSDGCQSGYGLLAGEIPEFAEAVRRNTALLKACTHDGLLYGGPMYRNAGEPACVHHTFCHAKALASLLEHGWEEERIVSGSVSLPSDKRQGILEFPSAHVRLIGRGPWRATVSDYDVEYSEEGHATGGAVTLLWHEAFGPVFAGSMGRYYLVEPNNMQLPRSCIPQCLTPRVEYEDQGVLYRNINDKSAEVVCGEDAGAVRVAVSGIMRDRNQHGGIRYQMRYLLNDERFVMEVCVGVDGKLYLPVITENGTAEVIKAESNAGLRVKRACGQSLHLWGSGSLRVLRERLFHPVGGMYAAECVMEMKAGVWYQVVCRPERSY